MIRVEQRFLLDQNHGVFHQVCAFTFDFCRPSFVVRPPWPRRFCCWTCLGGLHFIFSQSLQKVQHGASMQRHRNLKPAIKFVPFYLYILQIFCALFCWFSLHVYESHWTQLPCWMIPLLLTHKPLRLLRRPANPLVLFVGYCWKPSRCISGCGTIARYESEKADQESQTLSVT